MSIRMQRDIDELKTQVEKLEAVAVKSIARLDALEKRKPVGRPKKNGTELTEARASAEANN